MYDFAIQLNMDKGKKYLPLLDNDFPNKEQLPRKAIVGFQVGENPGAVQINFIQANGKKQQLGHELRDNTYTQDGWGRYHDGGHLCYSLLGWCLHLRSFLKLKRKSNPLIDEVEDGAQANIADESIVFALINKARRDNLVLNTIEDVPSILIDFARLQFFGKELEDTSDNEWRQVFFAMYHIINQLRINKGGYVYINLFERSIAYAQTLNTGFYK